MTPADAQRRIAGLRAQVARHDEIYHRRAQPEISDFDYDQLKRELTESEAQLASTDSPTQHVGDDRAQDFKEVANRQKMLIPEPSTCVAFFGSAASGFAAYRRRTKSA
jgi:DNA ligase (NAD+)